MTAALPDQLPDVPFDDGANRFLTPPERTARALADHAPRQPVVFWQRLSVAQAWARPLSTLATLLSAPPRMPHPGEIRP